MTVNSVCHGGLVFEVTTLSPIATLPRYLQHAQPRLTRLREVKGAWEGVGVTPHHVPPGCRKEVFFLSIVLPSARNCSSSCPQSRMIHSPHRRTIGQENSQLTTHNSQLTAHSSQLTAHSSQLTNPAGLCSVCVGNGR
jgi:hypothetical protein